MEFVIITGMSGGGKSIAVKCFEDMGYYCVDNMPSSLFSHFAKLSDKNEYSVDKFAFVIDIRSQKLSEDIFSGVDKIRKNCKILFLDADDNTIVKRYKETRRSHPLSEYDRIYDGIEKERKILDEIKNKSDFIIDTSNLLPKELREQITNIFISNKNVDDLKVNVISFGFKYGIPLDADLVFDVRFLPNPYYIEHLKEKTGLDNEVADYVKSFDDTKVFMQKLKDMLEFLMPCYVKDKRGEIVIAIGCTGGKHRSVTLANYVEEILIKMNIKVKCVHRDITKGR